MKKQREGFQSVADILKDNKTALAKKLNREIKPLSKLKKASADELAAIWSRSPGLNDLTYIHTVLCQVSFPRRPVEGLRYEVKYRNAHMLISAGELFMGKKKGYVQQGIPWGVYARLLMNIFTTKAIQTQSATIEIGRSRSEFLREHLHRSVDGETGALMLRQLLPLMACTLQLGGEYPDGRILNAQGKPFLAFEAWRDDSDKQPMLWPGYVQFSADHFNSLINGAAVPLDDRQVLWLSKNGGALAIDVYWWLSQRLKYVTEANGVPIGWKALKQQFGQEYADMRDFRKAFKFALRQVLMVYRDAKVVEFSGGIRLYQSRPPIPSNLTLLHG